MNWPGGFELVLENCIEDIIIILAFGTYWKDGGGENEFAKAFTRKSASTHLFGASDFGHLHF